MFSFRTTTIDRQLDKALTEGRVAVYSTPSSFNTSTMEYTDDIFRKRGNLLACLCPSEGEMSEEEFKLRIDNSLLDQVAAVVVDFQDSGVRECIYTRELFSLMHTLQAIFREGHSISLYIVDHPNPAGRQIEGTMPDGKWTAANVYLPRVALRHALTLGELSYLYHSENEFSFPLHVISACASDMGVLMPWTIPSEKICGFFSAPMASGGSLWQYTSVTAGTGTPRPYEFIGAPFIDNAPLNPVPSSPSVIMRPCTFIPSSGIYGGQLCRGYQLLLQPLSQYHSLLHTLDLMRHFRSLYPEFTLGEDFEKHLCDDTLLSYIMGESSFEQVRSYMKEHEQKWLRRCKKFLLYEDEPCRLK